MTWNQRYKQAYEQHHATQYPVSTADFGCPLVKYPVVSKSNGLTLAIVNYLTWQGHRATRINVAGRLLTEQYNGRIVSKGYIPSTTRRGAADISATIRGRSVMIEVKCGADVPSQHQLDEQQRERAAGGIYEFVHNMDEFFELYDKILSL